MNKIIQNIINVIAEINYTKYPTGIFAQTGDLEIGLFIPFSKYLLSAKPTWPNQKWTLEIIKYRK